VNRNEISGAVVDAAMKVHSALGPGLLESAYAACLKHELIKRGLKVACEVPLPVIYDGIKLEAGYRLDQIISYLKLSGKPIGLLVNFHTLHLKDGIKRFVI